MGLVRFISIILIALAIFSIPLVMSQVHEQTYFASNQVSANPELSSEILKIFFPALSVSEDEFIDNPKGLIQIDFAKDDYDLYDNLRDETITLVVFDSLTRDISGAELVDEEGNVIIDPDKFETIEISKLQLDVNYTEDFEMQGKSLCERTEFTNTFCEPGYNVSIVHLKPVNYKDDGVFKRIERQIKQIDNKNKELGKINKKIQDRNITSQKKIDQLRERADYDLKFEETSIPTFFKNDPTMDRAVKIDINDHTVYYSAVQLEYYGNNKIQLLGKGKDKKGLKEAKRNKAKFNGLFADGIGLDYAFSGGRVVKNLIIYSQDVLPAPRQILGSDPVLRLKEKLEIPSDLTAYIGGVAFTGSEMTTLPQERIEFRDSDGDFVFEISSGLAEGFDNTYGIDSSGNITNDNSEIYLTYTLETQGKSTYLYTNVPYAWLTNENRIYPINIDPTTTVDVGATNRDGYWQCEKGTADSSSCLAKNGTAFCAGTQIEVGRPDTSDVLDRGIVSFDVTFLDAGDDVTDADLRLYLEVVYAAATIQVVDLGSNYICASLLPGAMWELVQSRIDAGHAVTKSGAFDTNPVNNFSPWVDLSASADTDLEALPTNYPLGLKVLEENAYGTANGLAFATREASTGLDAELRVVYTAPVPNAPTNLSVDTDNTYPLNSGLSGQALTWTDNSSDETAFEIDRKIDQGSWTTNYDTASTNATTYADLGLSGTTYSYRVRATNGNGDSANSNTISVNTPDRTGSAPQTLTATADGANNEVDLSWTLDSGSLGTETLDATWDLWSGTFAPESKTGWDGDYFFSSTSTKVNKIRADFIRAQANISVDVYTGLAHRSDNIFYSQDWTGTEIDKWTVTNNGSTWTEDTGFVAAVTGGRECLGMDIDGNYLYCNSDDDGVNRGIRVDRYLIGNTGVTFKGFFDDTEIGLVRWYQ